MAVVFLCGAECGSTLRKTTLLAPATLTTSGVITGQRSWRCAGVGATTYFQHFLTTAAATSVARWKARWDALPSSAADWRHVLGVVSAGAQFQVTVSNVGVVKYGIVGGTQITHPTTIVAGTLYRFDARVLNNDGTGTKKIDVQIDGVAGSQATLVEAGANVTAWRFGGPNVTANFDVTIDDIIIGDATGDYPFGPGVVTAVYPNADGTHSFTAGDFGDDVGTVLSSATNLNDKIDESLMPAGGATLTASDWLEQIVANTAGYLEFVFDTAAITGAIKGIAPVAAVQAETAAGTVHEIRVNDNGTVETGATRGAAAVAVTTIDHSYKVLALRPSTSTAWTAASLSTLKVRWGYSSDATPDVRLDSLIVEIEHIPETNAAAGNAAGTGAASAGTDKISPTSGASSGTGAASAATTKIAPVVAAASGTGAASSPSATVAPVIGIASGTGAALDATVDAVDGTTETEADAELASGTGAAAGPTTAIAPTSGVASGTGAALTPSPSMSVDLGSFQAVGSADPDIQHWISLGPTVPVATGTGTAFAATVATTSAIEADAEAASGTGTAFGVQASTTDEAPADTATGTGAAESVSTSIALVVGAATGTGTANDATATGGGITDALAVTATGNGAAAGVTASVAPTGGIASGFAGTYYDLVLGDSPIAYWRLGEGSGNPQDSVGTNHVTAVGGSPSYGQSGALTGDPNKAVAFNGTTDYFTVPSSANLDVGDVVTIEAWIIKGPAGVSRGIVSRGITGYYLRLNGGNRLNLLKSSTASIVLSPLEVPSGWCHVVATKNGSAVHLYVNGVDATGTVTDATLANPVAALSIGAESSGAAERFNGSIDEVAIYSYALTAAQVLAHYQGGIGAGRVASVSVALTAGGAAGTGEAFNLTASVATTAQVASGTGSASDVQASTTDEAPGDTATGSGTANDGSTSIAPVVGAAAGTGTALDATATGTGAGEAAAAPATGTGEAFELSAAVATTVGVATGAGAATDVQASTTDEAPGDTALGSGTGFDPSTSVAPVIEIAGGTGQAFDATAAAGGVGQASADVATGVGAAFDASIITSVVPVAPAGTSTAGRYRRRRPTDEFGYPTDMVWKEPPPLDKRPVLVQADIARGFGKAFDPTTTWDDDESALPLLLGIAA